MAQEKKILPFFKLGRQIMIEPFMGFDGFRSQIIGIKAPDYLILENPIPKKDISLYPWKNPLWARYFHYSLYRFQTKALKIQYAPSSLMFVLYPEAVERLDFRKGDRRQVFIKACVHGLETEYSRSEINVIILDISKTGCLLLADLNHLVDRDVLLSFKVPWTGEEFEIKALVVRCDASEQGLRSGLRFFQMDRATQGRYLRFIEALQEGKYVNIIG